MSVDGCERRLDLLCVGLDDRRDDFVLGLEVVVDVAGRDTCGSGDVGERGPFNALFVQELGGSVYQPLWPSPHSAGVAAGVPNLETAPRRCNGADDVRRCLCRVPRPAPGPGHLGTLHGCLPGAGVPSEW